MGQAFRPSRSGYYGAPERQAWMNLSNSLMGILNEWSEDEYRAEAAKQRSQAQVALMDEQDGLLDDLTKNHGHEPDAWPGLIQQNSERIKKAVLQGVRLPEVRQQVGLDFDEKMQRFVSRLKDKRRTQIANNVESNYSLYHTRLKTESQEYGDEGDAVAHVERMRDFTLANGEALGPERAAYDMREGARQILGDYAVQAMLRTEDEGVLDSLNGLAEQVLGPMETPVFGPEELAEVRERYKAAVGAAERDAANARKARAANFDMEATTAILRGQLARPDGRTWRDAIIGNMDVTAAEKRALTSLYDEKAGKDGGPVSRPARLQALYYVARQTKRYLAGEIDEKKWWDVYSRYAGRLDEADAQKYLEKMVGTTGTDPRQQQIEDAMEKADKEATDAAAGLMATLQPEREVYTESPEEAEFVGTVLNHMDSWTQSTFPEGKPFDPQKFRVERNRFIYQLLKEREQGEAEPEPEPEPVEKPKKKKQVIPQEVLDELSEDTRAKVLKASPAQQRAFLRAYREAQANAQRAKQTDLLGVNAEIQNIPSSGFAR